MKTMSRNLFWTLLEAEHPKAEAFCRKLAKNRDDGNDLYQDALLTAWRKFKTLRNVESFRPWLYKIIVNTYNSQCRKPWWNSFVNLSREVLENRQVRDTSGQITARIWLEKAFKVLSAEERALVILFELEGWNITELAGLYGKPEGTIKSRLSRARRKMREEIARFFPRGEINSLKVEAEYALPGNKTSLE